MKGLVIIACIAFLVVRSESWSYSDCSCGICPPDCVCTKQNFYFGGRDISTCYCKCPSPSDNNQPPPPPPPADKKGHHPPPPPPPADEKKHQPPPPTDKEKHQPPPPPPPPTTCECPSPPNDPVPAPPKSPPSQQTPPSQQECDWWVSRIDPGCDTFAKIIPTMPTGPGFVKFVLAKSCCEAIENARECYPDLYAGLDLQNNCYH